MKNFPALPPGWTLSAGYLTNPNDGSERYVLGSDRRVDRLKVSHILSNYGHEEHADAWATGFELLNLLRRARAYINEVGTLGAPGGPGFVPNLKDPQTRLAREIDQYLVREDGP